MMMLIMMMMMMLCVNVPRGLTMFLWGQVTFRLEDRGEDWGGGGCKEGRGGVSLGEKCIISRVLFFGMHAFYIFIYLFWLGRGTVFHFFP